MVLAGRRCVATGLELSGFVRSCGLWKRTKEESCFSSALGSDIRMHFRGECKSHLTGEAFLGFVEREKGGVMGPSVAVSGPWGLM